MSFNWTNSLFLRIVSALLLMPVVLAALILGGWFFLTMLMLAIVVATKEWLGISLRLGGARIVYLVLGLLYILICFAAFGHLRLQEDHGTGLALALILSIWASDTGAYIAGKTIGGPKIAPSISPNKTWAGLVGGMVASAAALVVYTLYLGPWSFGLGVDLALPKGTSVTHLAILGALLTIAGQAGDFLESYFKRKAGLKDSGVLIPGHGGLLDRIDALLLASVFFLAFIKVLGL